MFGMLSVLAELQRELILANTPATDSLRHALADVRAGAGPGSTRSRSRSRNSSTTPATTLSSRADLFSVLRTTVYGHLDNVSKGKRPAIHRKPKNPADAPAR
jgi:hypothetical protein